MKKERIIFIISLITIIISSIVSVYAASYLYNSNEVSYNNTSSGITSDNVQGAIDELYEHATDYNNMNTRVTTLEGKVVDDSTFEQGYITYPNGLVIIYGKKSLNKSVASTWGNVYMSGEFNPGISFPITCSTVYSINVSLERSSGIAGIIANFKYTTSSINNIEIMRGTAVSNADYVIDYVVFCKK